MRLLVQMQRRKIDVRIVTRKELISQLITLELFLQAVFVIERYSWVIISSFDILIIGFVYVMISCHLQKFFHIGMNMIRNDIAIRAFEGFDGSVVLSSLIIC